MSIDLMVSAGRSARVKIAPVNQSLENRILFLWLARWKSYSKVCNQKGRHASYNGEENNRMAFSMGESSKHDWTTLLNVHNACWGPQEQPGFFSSKSIVALSGVVCHPVQWCIDHGSVKRKISVIQVAPFHQHTHKHTMHIPHTHPHTQRVVHGCHYCISWSISKSRCVRNDAWLS